jgi:hypothetical protein
MPYSSGNRRKNHSVSAPECSVVKLAPLKLEFDPQPVGTASPAQNCYAHQHQQFSRDCS